MLEVILKGFNKPIGLSCCLGAPLCSSSASASKYAANKNLQSVQDTNAQNYKIWQEQKDYDYTKWKEQLAYNTPSAQRERLEAAGINPQLAMNNLSTGEATSNAGGQNPPQMEAPQIDAAALGNAVANDKNNIVQSLGMMSSILKQAQEAKEIQIRNSWANIKNTLDVAGTTKDNSLKDQAIKAAKLQNEFTDRTMEDNIQLKSSMATYVWRQALNESAKGSLLELQKDVQTYYRDKVQPAELQKVNADIHQALTKAISDMIVARSTAAVGASQIQVNHEMVNQIKSQTLNNLSDNKAKEFLNRVNDRTFEAVVNKIISEARNSNLQPLFQFMNAASGFIP
nr:MAG: DNA pilot protein [Microvirus sp.]